MYKHKPSKNPLIAHIYKAGECMDLNDVEIAMQELEKVKASLNNVRGANTNYNGCTPWIM